MCDLSIVLPIYNEAENIPRLYDELMPVLEATGSSFEIIAVDDGSSDGDHPEGTTVICAAEDSLRDVASDALGAARAFGRRVSLHVGGALKSMLAA